MHFFENIPSINARTHIRTRALFIEGYLFFIGI